MIDNVITNLKNNLCHKTLKKWQSFKVKVRVGEDHLKEDLKKLKRSTAYYINKWRDKLSKDTLNTLFGRIRARTNTHLKDSYNSSIGDRDLKFLKKLICLINIWITKHKKLWNDDRLFS